MTPTAPIGKPSETRILLYILAQLREHYPNDLWERQNVVVAQTENRSIRAGTKGQADIGGCHRGLFVELEVKTPTGVQTASQRKRQVDVIRAGGVYAIVRSPAEAFAIIEAL